MNSTHTPRYAGAGAALGIAALVGVFVVGAMYFKQYARDMRVAHAYMCGRVSVMIASIGSGAHESERCRQVRETWEAMK